MRAILRWAGIALFLAVSAFLIWFGATYAGVKDMLWFHAAAVPEEAHDAVRTLYLALMKLVGGSSIALGVLGAYVALGPVRQGAPGASVALAVCFAIPFGTAAYVAEKLADDTGAPTSWHIMGVLLAVTACALVASLLARAQSRRA